jgi:hypothetical protein
MSQISACGEINIGEQMNHQTIYDREFTPAVSCRRESISISVGWKEFRSEHTEKQIA